MLLFLPHRLLAISWLGLLGRRQGPTPPFRPAHTPQQGEPAAAEASRWKSSGAARAAAFLQREREAATLQGASLSPWAPACSTAGLCGSCGLAGCRSSALLHPVGEPGAKQLARALQEGCWAPPRLLWLALEGSACCTRAAAAGCLPLARAKGLCQHQL